MRMTITIGDETFTLPARKAVCSDCEGCGTVMNPSMRGHAYTEEEFRDFSEDEREAYFTRGGMYDVTCPTCKGANVVDTPNERAFTDEDREVYARWQEDQAEDAAYDRMCRAEVEYGC